MTQFYGIEAESLEEAQTKLRLHVGSNLRALREMKGFSLADVAKIVGKNPQTIANYETGQSGLGYDMAWTLCGIYGVSIGTLGGRVNYEPPRGEPS